VLALLLLLLLLQGKAIEVSAAHVVTVPTALNGKCTDAHDCCQQHQSGYSIT
jgi:hypothetical protein